MAPPRQEVLPRVPIELILKPRTSYGPPKYNLSNICNERPANDVNTEACIEALKKVPKISGAAACKEKMGNFTRKHAYKRIIFC